MLRDVFAVGIVTCIRPQFAGARMDVADLAITAFIKSDRTEADAEDDEAESKTGLGKAREIRPELGACLHEMTNLLAIFFAGRDVGNEERQQDRKSVV